MSIFIVFLLGINILLLPNILFASPEISPEESQSSLSNIEKEKILDALLGPDVNYPFRPENHRDNSGPVTRIGPLPKESEWFYVYAK